MERTAIPPSAGEPDMVRAFEAHRRELLAHCYRMLGSLEDAEDALQEASVRAWRGAPGFGGRAAPRAWLHAIATRVCLDALERGRARARLLPQAFGSAAERPDAPPRHVDEPVWLEPYPDALLAFAEPGPEARFSERESVALAFLAAIQRVPPRQRAVLLLRDVVGLGAAEAADLLETSVAAVNAALQRARAALEVALPAGPELDPPDAAQAALLARYVRAFEEGDVAALTALLREDAVLSMPPDALWFRGREAIAAFLDRTALAGAARGRWRLLSAGANAQPAFGLYERDESGGYRAVAVKVLAVRGGRVAEITGFLEPRLFPRFGIAPRLRP